MEMRDPSRRTAADVVHSHEQNGETSYVECELMSGWLEWWNSFTLWQIVNIWLMVGNFLSIELMFCTLVEGKTLPALHTWPRCTNFSPVAYLASGGSRVDGVGRIHSCETSFSQLNSFFNKGHSLVGLCLWTAYDRQMWNLPCRQKHLKCSWSLSASEMLDHKVLHICWEVEKFVFCCINASCFTHLNTIWHVDCLFVIWGIHGRQKVSKV